MAIKSVNSILGQIQMAKGLNGSNSTLKLYRQDINMLSSHRVLPNSYERRQKSSGTNLDDNAHRDHDLIKRQMTSRKPTIENVESAESENKKSVKGGPIHEPDEFNND